MLLLPTKNTKPARTNAYCLRRVAIAVAGILIVASNSSIANAGTVERNDFNNRSVAIKQPAVNSSPSSVPATTALGFDSAKTWLFAVGVLKFADADTTSWSTRNRRDRQLVSFIKSCGVPASHIVFLKDEDATLSEIQRSFGMLLDQTKPHDSLICYYTGHGGDGLFETYDGNSWNHKLIKDRIDTKFKGSRVLLLGDCCNSGSLIDLVRSSKPSIATACMSSSSRDESGNGRWTFSQSLLEGLNGDPACDLDHDGRITFDELGHYIQKQILIYETNHSVYEKTPFFDGRTTVAATRQRNAPDPQPVKVFYHGKWWKAKQIERTADQARIRWIDIGYDSPEQDAWVALENVRPIESNYETAN